jgi:hypothetical protein
MQFWNINRHNTVKSLYIDLVLTAVSYRHKEVSLHRSISLPWLFERLKTRLGGSIGTYVSYDIAIGSGITQLSCESAIPNTSIHHSIHQVHCTTIQILRYCHICTVPDIKAAICSCKLQLAFCYSFCKLCMSGNF